MAENDGKIVIGIEGDPSGVNKALDQVEQKGKKTASTVSSAFTAIGTAFASAQVVGAMKTAFDAANRLEKTMLGLQATAKLTGQSFDVLKSSVTSLAKDGVMSIDQAANSMKILAAQGVSAQKSFEFLEAAKKVSAFNNIVGDAGEGVANFVKFLQTGSAELAENMDPSLVAVVKRLGGYAAVTQDATKKQALMNAVIEKGGKMTADYQKFLESGGQSQVAFAGAATTLAQTFGQKLQPAMAAVYNTGTKILTFLGDVIGKLDSTTVAVVAFSVAGFGAIATFAKTAALLPKIFGSLGASITAALGPIGLVIAAAGAAFIAFSKLRDAYGQTKGQDMLEERKALEDIGKKQALSISQRERLKQLNAEIAKTYDPILKKLGLENLAFEEQLRLIGAIDRERKKAASGGAENAARSRAALQESIAARRRTLAGFAQTDFSKMTASQSAERLRQIELLGQSLREDKARLASYGDEEASAGGMARGAGGGNAGPEFRFIKARDELRKLQKEYDQYIKKVGATSELGMQATARYGVDVAAIRGNLRGAIAEYNEERTQAELDALEVARKKQVENIMELATLEGWEKKKVDEELQRAREANAYKIAQINAESYTRTLQGANQIVSAIATGGAAAGGGVISGLGAAGKELTAQGVFSEDGNASRFFKTASIVGPIMNAAGGLLTGITGLFSKSDAQLAREADAQRRRDEEARAILELQAGYQKSMLALQEAQAQLPFGNLTRKLRLIEIQAQQERAAGGDEKAIEQRRLAARQQAIQQTIEQKAGSIGAGKLFSGVEATPESLIAVLNEAAALKIETEPLAELSRQLRDSVYNRGAEVTRAIQDKIFEELRRLGYDAGWIQSGNARLGNYGSTLYQAFAEIIGSPARDSSIPLSTKDKLIAQIIQSGGSDLSELNIDTTTAESLLSVIEQSLQAQLDIEKNTKATADNTGRLTQMRETTILDLAGGGLRGFGSFFRGAFNSIDSVLNPQMPALATPSAISNSLTIASLTRSWQERTADGIEQLVKIQTEALQLLAEIAINSNRAGDVGGSLSESDLLNIMAKVRSRLV